MAIMAILESCHRPVGKMFSKVSPATSKNETPNQNKKKVKVSISKAIRIIPIASRYVEGIRLNIWFSTF